MAKRQNTNNPIPSNAMADLNDNTIILDEFANSQENYTSDRFGNKFRTLKKFMEDVSASASIILRECPDVGTLRQTEPTAANERMTVYSYFPNKKIGGGVFFYDEDDTTSIDDGGYCIVTSGSKRWKRVENIKDLHVLHFGALNDGETDCKDAVTRMFNFSKNNFPQLGIVFPEGKFLLSNFNSGTDLIDYFSVKGVSSNFGYFSQTTIISDFEENTLFEVNSRRTEISDITFDGQINTQLNKKGFFKNTCPGGQFTNIQRIWWKNVGGKCLHLLDTLDTYIGQFYANDCIDNIILTEWTNHSIGNWDHVTAIELANFNIQKCKQESVFDIQRATQSIMRNGWIEYCDSPGNISNGQWIIDALSMEECTNPLYCRFSNVICRQINLQTGSKLDFENGADESWQSAFENGHIRIENTGIQIVEGSCSYNYLTHELKITNNTKNPAWYNIGYLFLSKVGAYAKLRIISPHGFSSFSNVQKINYEGIGNGEGIIYLQSTSDGRISCAWDGMGSCPIQNVKFTSPEGGDINIYIQFTSNVLNSTILCETNDSSRFNDGTHFRFNRSATLMTEDQINQIPNIKDALCQGSYGVNAGIGWNNDGNLLLKGKIINDKKLSVIVNGTQFYINLES